MDQDRGLAAAVDPHARARGEVDIEEEVVAVNAGAEGDEPREVADHDIDKQEHPGSPGCFAKDYR